MLGIRLELCYDSLYLGLRDTAEKISNTFSSTDLQEEEPKTNRGTYTELNLHLHDLQILNLI